MENNLLEGDKAQDIYGIIHEEVMQARIKIHGAAFNADSYDRVDSIVSDLVENIYKKLSLPASNTARNIEARKQLKELWDLVTPPEPMCRDCADSNPHGTCDIDGKPCDPHERAILEIKLLKMVSNTAIQEGKKEEI